MFQIYLLWMIEAGLFCVRVFDFSIWHATSDIAITFCTSDAQAPVNQITWLVKYIAVDY